MVIPLTSDTEGSFVTIEIMGDIVVTHSHIDSEDGYATSTMENGKLILTISDNKIMAIVSFGKDSYELKLGYEQNGNPVGLFIAVNYETKYISVI